MTRIQQRMMKEPVKKVNPALCPKAVDGKFDYDLLNDEDTQSHITLLSETQVDVAEVLDIAEDGEVEDKVEEYENFSDEEAAIGDENKFYEKLPGGICV